MSEIDKKTTGLYKKFEVKRTDGTDARGMKHDGCEYFVLDLSHDIYAAPALRAYARACAEKYPALARDLNHKAAAIEWSDDMENRTYDCTKEPQ